MSLRFLFVIHTPRDERTAVFLSTSRTAEHLRRAGHSVEILTPSDLPIDLPRLRPLVYPFLVFLRAPWRYDVVVFHSHAGWAFHALGRLWPRRRGCDGLLRRTVTMFHGLEPLYHAAVRAELARRGQHLSRRFRLLNTVIVPRLLRLSCRRSDRVLCLNRTEAEYLLRNGWCESEALAVVANGVEADFFVEPSHVGRGRTLLFLGQWLPAKGTHYLAEAFRVVVEARPDTTLVCLGTGAAADSVLADFDNGVRSRVRVVPQATRTDVLTELLRADAVLFPTLSEGFSGALIEAMATGRAIAATRAGAASELLQDDVNAVLVPYADATALAGAALRLLDDGGIRQKLGKAAAATARSYTWDRVSERYVAELVRQPAASPAAAVDVPHVVR
jgi:glycosyltransferase involved in cell wall biosynthesis